MDELLVQVNDFRRAHIEANGSLRNLAITLTAPEYDRLVDELDDLYGWPASRSHIGFNMYGVDIKRYPPKRAVV